MRARLAHCTILDEVTTDGASQYMRTHAPSRGHLHAIRVLNGGQPMRNGNRCPALRRLV